MPLWRAVLDLSSSSRYVTALEIDYKKFCGECTPRAVTPKYSNVVDVSITYNAGGSLSRKYGT